MAYQMAFSAAPSLEGAVEEIAERFPAEPKLIFFLCDGQRFEGASEALHRRYPRSEVVGISTFSSFSPAGMSRAGINAAAFSEDFCLATGVIREVTRHPAIFFKDEIVGAAEGLSSEPLKADDTCCLVFNPAGTANEETVLDVLSEALKGTDIPVFGGSASSEICARGAVSLNGKTYVGSSVYVLLHLNKGHFSIIQENIFAPMGPGWTVTQADTRRRTLYALDGRPASQVLCEALDVAPEGLADALAAHPLGRLADGRLLINEVERVNPDGSVTAYCRFFEGSSLSLLKLADFETTMADTFARLHEAVPQPAFSLAVNCYSRTQLYLKRGWMPAFAEKMAASLGPYLGFTSHGEQLGGDQLNLTLLILAFARDPV
jgi:hypothetical protein